MEDKQWQLISTMPSFDKAKEMVKTQFNVCQYRRSDLNHRTKYSFKCSEYRKYPLCSYEIKITVPDDNPQGVEVMARDAHCHGQNARNPTTRLPSPIRKTVADGVRCGLSHNQIRSSLNINHPGSPIDQTKLRNLVLYERRKDRPEIFSIFDLKSWCQQRSEGSAVHSTYVPYYRVNDVNDLFIFFTTRQLFQQIRLTNYLQVDATYKLTWNNFPLLVFGSTDANRHFKPFGMALISDDENIQSYNDLFHSINSLALQELRAPCVINQVMADGTTGQLIRRENLISPTIVSLSSDQHSPKFNLSW